MRFPGFCQIYARNWFVIRLSIQIYGGAAVIGGVLGIIFAIYNVPLPSIPVSKPIISFEAILRQNLLALTLLALGVALAGSTTILVLLFSGLVHGSAFFEIAISSGDPIVAFALFVPHSLFELPAIFLAGGAGFRVPADLYSYLTESTDTPVETQSVIDFFVLVSIAVPLIVIAAYIEATITPMLVS